jgi:hypothetical protein
MVDSLIRSCLSNMESAFRQLESRVPAPRLIAVPMGPAMRYEEKTIHQAILQKAARLVSGLHAIRVLMLAGLGQEQAVIQRTVDEIDEDIVFLAQAVASGELTELHERYLADFWAEEFDEPTALASTQRRGMVKRKNIRAAIARSSGLPDPSWQDTVKETNYKSYSGFVHAASPHIMDMCGGDPPRFHLATLRGTPRMASHGEDALNYFFRGHLTMAVAANAFGEAKLAESLLRASVSFESAFAPNTFMPTEEEYEAVRRRRGKPA